MQHLKCPTLTPYQQLQNMHAPRQEPFKKCIFHLFYVLSPKKGQKKISPRSPRYKTTAPLSKSLNPPLFISDYAVGFSSLLHAVQ